jgi:exo-beta-1,3-glucanase (GH17 family)/cellulose synthase/poly-beta-1,6-N-acetylglucosamine synthase-like glycosyltransferase
MRKNALIVLIVMAVNLGLWAFFNRPADPQLDFTGQVKAVSFSPYRADQDPLVNKFPTPKQIEEDIVFLKGKAGAIRTYSSLDGMELIPGLAEKHGMPVMAGAWLDKRLKRNEQEIAGLIKNLQEHKNITRVFVGNESILRGDFTVAQLSEYIRRIKEAAPDVQVSTAEPWHVWINNPKLADSVDFISIHILPYWERVPEDKAIEWSMKRYHQVVERFPDKHVLVAEIGWPSNGERWGKAKASIANEAKFLRQFMNLAAQQNIDYCVMEAFDQPWKRPLEGVVGAHWGIWTVDRTLKIPLVGTILEDTLWPVQFGVSLLCLIPMLFFLYRRRTQPFSGRLFFSLLLQTVTSSLVWIAFTPITIEFLPAETAAWAMLLPMQIGLLAVVLINGYEMSEMLWPEGLRRRFFPLRHDLDAGLPKVSIHVACCKEPPEMVIATMNSLAALDYPSFEVLLIDNNTTDPAQWKPLEEHCAKLGSRFRFFHLEEWPGYKAGALNFALQKTAKDARVVAVVDSDYQVRPSWLRSLTPYFEKPDIAIVQSPQDHREWAGDPYKTVCAWEYDGFFRIGMVHRNERNAIIQHGTMTMIRKAVLEEVGGWGEWCICEDAELGLKVIERGYQAIYVPESFGQGLTPDTYAGFKRQRFRWAYGAVQILKRHWRQLLPWNKTTSLDLGQKYHFIAGWLPWFADATQIAVLVVSLVWSLGMLVLPRYFGTPLSIFLLPPLGAFLFKLFHFMWLYQTRVKCGFWARIGAAVAGLALTHTIAKAIFQGVFTSKKPFLRTPKCEERCAVVRGLLMAREELMILALLWLAAAGVIARYGTENPDIVTWAVILLVQSTPYLASLCLSLISVVPGIIPGVDGKLACNNACQMVAATPGAATLSIPVARERKDKV